MNNDFIIDYLNEYNDDELFYRDYYEASKSEKMLDIFIKQLNPDEINKRKLIVPEIKPDIIPTIIADLEYFDTEHHKSVYLSKHNRYTPVFQHKHEFFEMVYVISGKCSQVIGGNRINMTEGDLCLIGENVMHTLEVFDSSIVINILVRSSTFDDIFFNVIRNKGIISTFFIDNLYSKRHMEYIIFHTEADDIIKNKIIEMYAEQFVDDEYSDRLIDSMLCIFFTYLMRLHRSSAELPPTCKASDAENYKIVNFIQDNYNDISLDITAKHFNFSVPYCSKLIKSITGHTFSELLRMIRLRRSEILLQSTRMSITYISASLGYENPESFIRVFKKQYGISPSQYRNKFIE